MSPPEAAAAQRVDSARLQHLALAYWRSAALMSAVDLGIFTAVSQGAGDLEALARRAEISATNAERLVGVLVAEDLLRWQDGQLVNAPDCERFLVAGGRDYAGAWIHFTRPDWERWGRLTEFLRSKQERVLGMYEDFDEAHARRYHQATFSIGVGAGRRFARQVDLSARRLLIDLGGGSGAYSIVAAQQHPQLRAVVLDLAAVVPVAREQIERAGVADRVRAEACDFTRDPLPVGADVALMASNLPQYGRAIVRAVARRVFEALAPGGEFHLVGEMLDDDRKGPLSAALWALNEALCGSTGVAHTQGECVDLLREVGFAEVAATPFVPGVLTRVSGRKRA